MRFKTFLLALALPVSITACGERDETTTMEANSAASNEIALGNESMSATPAGDQDFVNKAAASDKFEIETSRLAAASASSAAVKSFAQMMIKAHTDSSAKLKSTVADNASGVAIDDTLNGEQQAKLDELKAKKGADFDSAYIAAQVAGHEQTLTELKNYASSGDSDALKSFAQDLVPIVTQHLSEAKALK